MKMLVVAVVALCFVLDSRSAVAGPGGPPGCVAQAQPLQLTSVSVPFKSLAAAPPGGSPSNLDYDFTSSGGIFCIQGFTMDAGVSVAVGPGEIGNVIFYLSRINGGGLSQPQMTLVDGSSGGFSPQEVTLFYGHTICSSGSIQFHATQFQASSGSGAAVQLFGTAIILAAPGVTVTVN